MNRLSAIDAFTPAFARVREILFQRFSLSVWLKMGIIGALGGGLSTASMNFNFRSPAFPPQFPRGNHSEDPMAEISRAIHSIHLADYVHIIVAVIAVLVVISFVFLYLFARFRFVLFDSVLNGPAVGRGWRRYSTQANRYFGFWIVFELVSWAVFLLVIGLPLWHAYKRGDFSGDNSLVAFFGMLASIALGAIAASLVLGIISTLAKDFIMPMMALDDLAMGDAWSVLWRVIKSEPGSWAAYLGLKFLFAILAGIGLSLAFFIALLPAIIIIGIPAGSLVIIGVMLVKAAGLAAGIIFFVLAGLLAVAGFFCLYLLLAAPVATFFPAYALYFFGGRYPKLGALLSPQLPPLTPAPQVAAPPSTVPQMPFNR